MRYINLEDNPPKQDWIERADDITAELLNAKEEDRQTIIEKNKGLWSELKSHLKDLNHNKCWYSDSKNDSAHCHIDHFRPKGRALDEEGKDKGGYWWLAFEWTNFRYSAPVENIRKRDYFHVNANKANTPNDSLEIEDIRFLDPTEIEDPTKLAFTNEGMVTPKSTIPAERNYIQAEYTIRRMNLNKLEMKETRKDKFFKTSILIKQTNKLVLKQDKNFCIVRKGVIQEKMKQLLALASSTSEYASAVQFCMKSAGLEWVDNILLRAA
ncbi:hypothetical protein D1815_06315 [Aquimarina sp. AD1]|uniref:hypothetical protein n=1 Tax=Aquimarina sp. (strain AD1) TaxID=1714848 RepID=UPI000E4FBFD1|nr:hypothetical protein [Aquimarina sp. AD1]AXT55388.1 hypothetical protein D1815_06315 [Aquimarina sp. AD1]RKN28714.1 hypothetical protein D7035_07710 [Aquimarina sp. AD1]